MEKDSKLISEEARSLSLNKTISRYLFCAWVICVLALLLLVVFWFGWLRPLHVDAGSWFSRGGTMLIIGPLLAEFLVVKINVELDKEGIFEYPYVGDARGKFTPKIRHLNYVVLAMIILGTLIWGFGDILFSRMAW